MSSLSEEAQALLHVGSDVPSAGPRDHQPSVEWDGTTGLLSTGPLTEEPKSWDALITDWGLDPAEVRVVPGSVQIRAWDANMGSGKVQRFRYYKAQLERRLPTVDSDDLETLKRTLMRRKRITPAVSTDSGGTRIVCLSDWQLGKSDGDGVTGSVNRIVAGIEHAARDAKGAARIVLAGMGDLVENCADHYAMQTFGVELDRREQMRLARRLILRAVDLLARLAPLDVVCVPGNHGEHRKDGKAFTTFSDNDDLACFEQVADITNSSDRYPDVRYGFPEDDHLVVTIDCDGVGVAFAHGHQLRGGGSTPQQKVEKWWAGQALGYRAAGDADILVTGHYHHLAVLESTGRTWLQCPAMDGGSSWWEHTTGNTAPAGLLSFTVGDKFAHRPWGALTLT